MEEGPGDPVRMGSEHLHQACRELGFVIHTAGAYSTLCLQQVKTLEDQRGQPTALCLTEPLAAAFHSQVCLSIEADSLPPMCRVWKLPQGPKGTN